MERRTILLGSAGALATVLAGCTGSGGGGDDGADGGDDGGTGDENANDGGTTADVPGLDTSAIDLDGQDVAVEVDGDDDEELHIELSVPEDDTEAEQQLRTLAGALQDAIEDDEKLKRKIETIYVTVVEDDEPVVAVYVDLDWALEYAEGNLSEEEFLEMVEQAEA